MPRPRIALALAALALTGPVLAAAVPASAGQPSGASLGCSGLHPAVAFASGHPLTRQPHHRPQPCGVTTPYAAAESHIVVTKDSTVVFSPAVLPAGTLGTGTTPIPVLGTTQSNASPAGLAVSHDRGRHWSFVKPSAATWNPTDHGDYTDSVTGRLFFEDYGPIPLDPAFAPNEEGPAHINVSTDDGRTWHHTAISTVFLPENPRFAAARPRVGQDRPHGYPNVLYFCANSNVGFTSPVIARRECFRSLDGGLTWSARSTLFNSTVPVHPECGSRGESFSAIDGYYPQPARDGSLYVMVSCGGTAYLARSTNEAASFPVIHTKAGPLRLPLSPPSQLDLLTSDLRIGAHDLFYLVHISGNELTLRVSGDHGVRWSKPMSVTPPGVAAIAKWSMAVRGDELAVGVLGQRKGSSTYDGFLVTSRSAGAALHHRMPVFFAAMLNPAGRPLLYGPNVQGAGYVGAPGPASIPFPPPFDIQLLGNDFIGATIGPDGRAWASFTKDCGPTKGSAGCVRTQDQTRGFAGSVSAPPVLSLSAQRGTARSSHPSAGHRRHAAHREGRGSLLAHTGGTPLLAVAAVLLLVAGLAGQRVTRRRR